SGASQTASVTTASGVSPANGSLIQNASQPVKLTIANAVVTKPGSTTYTFEVATDSGFANKVQSKDVAENGAGQTSVTLDTLTPAKDYYWHVRAQGGGTTGVFGATYKFTVGAAVTITTPVPVFPANGAQTTGTPSFTVTNVSFTGPAGPITYKYEISDSVAFTNIIVTATVSQGVDLNNQTAFTPQTGLPGNKTLYWRCTALDQTNGASSASSAPLSFTTSYVIDITKIKVAYPAAPPDISNWAQTGTIIAVEQDGNDATGGAMCISFWTSDNWPSIPFFGDPTVPIFANQWYFAYIGGVWYGGPGEYLRSDRDAICKSGQGTHTIGPDGGWIAPMNTWVPQPGEYVGYMISTPARNWPGLQTINERSNIIVQPWYDSSVQGPKTSQAKIHR
ncbi:MAG TPA: hypothetical protein VMV18_08655, partial [bacterium]|nr:hypothetical protein [bacterium]